MQLRERLDSGKQNACSLDSCLATKALESCPPALGLLLQQGVSSCFCLCME